MRFDHAILVVRDLDSARADFHDLGFRTVYGGEHTGGLTHNALICFADGSYLELMAPTDPAHLESQAGEGYLYLFQGGEGFAGYALHTDDLEAALEAMHRRGLAVEEPESGGRLRSDGVALAWRMAIAPPGMSPFFLTDQTPRELRVATAPEDTAHPNGASGVVGLVALVHDLDQALARYRAIVGAEPAAGTVLAGASTADFTLGGFRITLAEPIDEGGPLAAALQRRGETPYRLRLKSAAGKIGGLLNPTRSHGGELELVGGG